MEVIANVINKLPVEYSEVVTVVKGMTTISLNELKSKIRVFNKLKLKGTKRTKEIALFTQKYKGICKNCGKQGHKADVCRSKTNTSRTNANGTNEKMRKSAIIAIHMSGILQETAQNQAAHYAARRKKKPACTSECARRLCILGTGIVTTHPIANCFVAKIYHGINLQ